MCAISSLTSTFAISPPDEFLSEGVRHFVMKQLDKLRSDKAAGADELSPRLLMEVKDEICYPLLTIFKKSLNQTCIPDEWKSA